MANEINNAPKEQVRDIHESYEATVKINRVTLFDQDETKVSLNLTIATPIQGMVKKDGDFVDGQTNSLSFPRGAITRQITEVSDDVSMIRSMQREAFTQREFALLLIGSTITVKRDWHPKGYKYTKYDGTEAVVDRDKGMWFTVITSYHPSARARKALDAALMF